MSISSTSPAANLSASPLGQAQSWRKDFRQLAQALSAGDLQSAQQAFASLTRSQTSKSSAAYAANPPTDDFQAIGKALASGDLQGAQAAFAKLKVDFQAQAQASGQTHRGHHAHHPDHDADDQTSASTSAPPTPSLSVTG